MNIRPMPVTPVRIACALLLLWLPLRAQVGIALFPFVDSASGDLYTWGSAVVADYAFRTCNPVEELQVWDPVFLFRADSTGWTMDSDSLLLVHRSRWQWDAAIGGMYHIRGDSVLLEARICRYTDGSLTWERHRWQMSSALVWQNRPQLLAEIFSALRIQFDAKSRKVFRGNSPASAAAWMTYCAGYRHEMLGEASKALSAYGRAVQLSPELYPAEYRMARIYRSGGDYARAGQHLVAALSSAPRDPAVLAEIADFHLEHGRPDKVRKIMHSRKDLLEQSARGMTAIAKYHALRGEYFRAGALLTKAIAYGPSDLETQYLLGTVHLSLGQSQLASETFKQLVGYRPEYVGYQLMLGTAYRDAGMVLESVEILESALRSDPGNTAVLVALAHAYFSLRRYHSAEQLLMSAGDINPLLEEVELNRGVLYWHLGQTEAARQVIERAVREGRRHHADLLNNLGNMYLSRGQPRKAIRAYRRSLADRRNHTALYNLSRAHLSLGDVRAAYLCLEEVSRQLPARIDVLLELAGLARGLGRTADAERHYRRIMELVPMHEPALKGMVDLLCRKGRFEEALSYVEGFLSRYPYHRGFRLLMGELLLKMEWFEVAAVKYREITRDYKSDYDGMIGLGRSLHGIIVVKGGRVLDEAEQVLIEASRIRDEAEPDLLLAEIYLSLDQRARAMTHLTLAGAKCRDQSLLARIDQLRRRMGRQ